MRLLDTTAAPEELSLAAERLGLGRSISFSVGDDPFTYTTTADGFKMADGCSAPTVVQMTPAAWADLSGQVRTFINLFLSDELTFEQGGFDDLADWDPILKLLHAGIPLYDPARTDLSGVDVSRSFTPDATDDELRAQLTATGYLHIRGVFTADEIAAMNADVDRLAAEATEDDDRSWWVKTEDGTSALCRLVYATERSPVLRSALNDPRIERFGTLLGSDLRLCADRMEGPSVLIKVPGQTEGLSNIPWHQDCGMGGHAFMCPATSIGIQLTGSSPETGNFKAVPGSHGQTMHYLWEDKLADVPVVEINTEPGDITVHVQDLMHASPEPTAEGGRRTFYLTYYPAALWDHIGEGEAFNDLVRNRQADTAKLQG